MKILSLFATLFAFNTTFAQSEKLTIKKTFEIEIDPIAYVMNGYSIHGVYNYNRIRFDLGFFGIEQPSSITGNTDFKTMTTGFGLKVNYLLSGVRGTYAGVDIGYAENEVSNNTNEIKDTGHSISFGGHIGYRFFLFAKKENALSGLYLTPWAGLSYNLIYDEVKFENYKEGNLGYFATLHLGYRF